MPEELIMHEDSGEVNFIKACDKKNKHGRAACILQHSVIPEVAQNNRELRDIKLEKFQEF